MPPRVARSQAGSPRSLVRPPVAPALDVLAWVLAEIWGADDEDLQALRAGLIPPPGAGGDADRVPLRELDDLVVQLHPAAAAQDEVDLLLLPVGVAVGEAVVGWDALIAEAGVLQLEGLGRQTELQVKSAVEV